jgi:hypothetical protein
MTDDSNKDHYMPDFTKAHFDLLRRYQELQLRNSRFSAVEQQMINIRNKLDIEIAMHKRMHAFSNNAFSDVPDQEYANQVAEAVVDIFEVEVGLAVIQDQDLPGITMFGLEGAVIREGDQNRIHQVFRHLCEENPTGSILNIDPEHFARLQAILPLKQAYGVQLADAENGITLMVIGGILERGIMLYDPPDKERDIIFGIFAQQVLAQVINRKKNRTIHRQVHKIEKTGKRLARITESFLSFGPDPADNMNRLTRLAGELLHADLAAFIRPQGSLIHSVSGIGHGDPLRMADTCNFCFHAVRSRLETDDTEAASMAFPTLDQRFGCHLQGMKTCLGYPVMLGSRRLGTLIVVYASNYTPDENDDQVMKILSAGIAVEERRNKSFTGSAEVNPVRV